MKNKKIINRKFKKLKEKDCEAQKNDNNKLKVYGIMDKEN